eukprot:SAG31_NODE_38207_length_298_cov_0.763819_1_plen_89_part_01
MEQIHAHHDQTTRDFHNKIDSRRQRDSGLKGMIHSAFGSDPTAMAQRLPVNQRPLQAQQQVLAIYPTVSVVLVRRAQPLLLGGLHRVRR